MSHRLDLCQAALASTVILRLQDGVRVASYKFIVAADNDRREPTSWQFGVAGADGGFVPLSTVVDGVTTNCKSSRNARTFRPRCRSNVRVYHALVPHSALFPTPNEK